MPLKVKSTKLKRKGNARVNATRLNPSSKKYKEILSYYVKKWDQSRCKQTHVRAIYEVSCPSQRIRFKAFQHAVRSAPSRFKFAGPGNTLRRFHGTAMRCHFAGSPCTNKACSVCQILSNGFDIGKSGTASGTVFYGTGHYFTSMSSTAKGYGMKAGYTYQAGNWMSPNAGNCILVCSVVCGKCELVKGKTTRPIDRAKFSSRYIVKPNNVDELVVPSGRQILPRYVICF